MSSEFLNEINYIQRICRYDYEDCSADVCNQMMDYVEKKITDPSFIGKDFTFGSKTYRVKLGDNFSYVDPIDKSVATKQVQTKLYTNSNSI